MIRNVPSLSSAPRPTYSAPPRQAASIAPATAAPQPARPVVVAPVARTSASQPAAPPTYIAPARQSAPAPIVTHAIERIAPASGITVTQKTVTVQPTSAKVQPPAAKISRGPTKPVLTAPARQVTPVSLAIPSGAKAAAGITTAPTKRTLQVAPVAAISQPGAVSAAHVRAPVYVPPARARTIGTIGIETPAHIASAITRPAAAHLAPVSLPANAVAVALVAGEQNAGTIARQLAKSRTPNPTPAPAKEKTSVISAAAISAARNAAKQAVGTPTSAPGLAVAEANRLRSVEENLLRGKGATASGNLPASLVNELDAIEAQLGARAAKGQTPAAAEASPQGSKPAAAPASSAAASSASASVPSKSGGTTPALSGGQKVTAVAASAGFGWLLPILLRL